MEDSTNQDSLLQSRHSLLGDFSAIANSLTLDLADLLQLTFRANSWIGAVARSELADSGRGETALAVVGIRPCSGGEDSCFYVWKILRWGEEDQLVAKRL